MVMFATNCLAKDITFTIPDDKLPRVVEAMEGMFGIPDMNGDGQPDFTPNQWAKEAVRRFIVSTVRRWEASEAAKAAAGAVVADDDIAQ